VQTWSIDADPTQNAKQQVLTNIGSFAKLSVQAIGDEDVMMLYDSGIRSLRPRVASENAMVIDIGTPIDSLVQALLVTLTDAEKATACAGVEPSANRYTLYVPGHNGASGKFFVLSKFDADEQPIAAWTAYAPTYQSPITAPAANYTASTVTYTGLTIGATYAWKPGANEVQLVNGTNTFKTTNIFIATAATAVATGNGPAVAFTGALSQTLSFVPTLSCVFNGQLYWRTGDSFFLYGGYDNNTYDACGVFGQTPFLDCDAPSVAKTFTGMDAGFEGTWQIGFCGNYNSGVFTNIYNNTKTSFQEGNIPLGRTATHFALSFNEVSDQYARMSSMVVHFNQGEAKK